MRQSQTGLAALRLGMRAMSAPALGRESSSFYPTLPRVAATSAALTGLLGTLDGRCRSCILEEHTRLTLSRSRWFVTPQLRMTCVSIG